MDKEKVCRECLYWVTGRCWNPHLLAPYDFTGQLMDERSYACHLFEERTRFCPPLDLPKRDVTI